MSADAETLKPMLARVANGEPLAEHEAEAAFDAIMAGAATDTQIGALLMGLRLRGETVAEITGAVRAMRTQMLEITAPEGAIDVVGTGGDEAGTFNISTGAAFVVAGAGVPVAKHGNRSVSSQSGAADVLSALGVNLDADMGLVERAISEAGIGFLMAPRHHSAMKHVVGPRRELGIRTVFNVLGPLSNPARVKRQFTGAYSRAWIEPMAETLHNLGSEAAWVVHGSDGLDELTTTGPSYVAELKDGQVRTFEVTPEDAGLTRAAPDELKGGGPEENAAAIRSLLDGEKTPYRDIVLLNAGASLIVAGRAQKLDDAVTLAAAAIDEGHARAALDKLVAITNLDEQIA